MFDCRHQPLQLPDDLVGALTIAYGEAHRAYHNASHIAAVLDWYDRVADDVGWHQPAEVYVAVVFHDAIYVPGARDNEARSAVWARDVNGVDSDRVAHLIELTAGHGSHAAADHDAALFLDSDMAVIGAPADQFAQYDAAIAREYSVLPPELYRRKRREFLAKLLAMPRIFLTDYFHERLDAQARANLAAALTT